MSRKLRLLLLCSGFLLFTSQPLATETTSTQQQINNDFSPPLGTYNYKVTWGVISAGRATVIISRLGNSYRIVAEASAVGGVDKIYKLRYRGESEIDAEDLTPIRTTLTSTEGQRNKEKVIDYRQDGVLTTTETHSKKGTPQTTSSRDIQFEGPLLDPFSAIFLARQLDWQQDYAQEFEIFTGSSRYLVKLNAVNKRLIEVSGEMRAAWTIVPTVENLTNPEKNRKLDAAVIYLSADENKELLKLESRLFIGTVAMVLESFQAEK